jgi:hypothetical protein
MGLVMNLTRRPAWLVGNALDEWDMSFNFFEALRRGSLSLVEPRLVLSLVVALPVGARQPPSFQKGKTPSDFNPIFLNQPATLA